MVGDKDHRATLRHAIRSSDVEANEGQQLGSRKEQSDALHVTRGQRWLRLRTCVVEAFDRPPARRSHRREACVGIDDTGKTNGGQQWRVIHAVGVGIRGLECDVVVCAPCAHGFQLSRRPGEGSFEFAAVLAVGVHGKPSGDDVVEAESACERHDDVVWRRGGKHHLASLRLVTFDHFACSIPHERHQLIHRGVRSCDDEVTRLALHHRDTLASDQHRGQVLTEHVEDAIQQVFTGQ